jgi:hypothetical protein
MKLNQNTIMTFIKRIGPDPHENGAQTAGCRGCPDIWELENGDFAVIGIDITDAAVPKLPPTAVRERFSYVTSLAGGGSAFFVRRLRAL